MNRSEERDFQILQRTSEEAFDAALECISTLRSTPLEILGALKIGFLAKGSQYPHLSNDVLTITNSINYVRAVLSNPEPAVEPEHDRFEEN